MSGNLWAPRAPFRRACVRVGVRARIMRACVPVRAHACPRVPTGACACPRVPVRAHGCPCVPMRVRGPIWCHDTHGCV